MRRWILIALLLGGGLAIVGAWWQWSVDDASQVIAAQAQQPRQQQRNAARAQGPTVPVLDVAAWPTVDTVTVRLWFGRADTEPTTWDGRVEAEGAQILRVRPWRFDGAMQVSTADNSWRCGSWLGPEPRSRPFDMHLPSMPQPFVSPGVLVDLDADLPGPVQLHVETTQGMFTVDVSQLARQGQTMYLDGRASAELAVFGYPVATRSAADELVWHDYPSISVSPLTLEEQAVCWQTYDEQQGGDFIQVRLHSPAGWQPPHTLTEVGDYYRTEVRYDGDGTLWAVYAAQVVGNWDLYAARLDGGVWEKNIRLTDDPEPDIHHRLVREPGGALWLVWQGFRNGQSDILARRWDGTEWSPTVQVSDSPANDWEPAVTPCDGGIAVAWDTYDAGNYDVCCRRLRAPQNGAEHGEIIRVTSSPNLEARASIAADRHGRFWVAYDVAGPNWGKDTGFWLELGAAPQGSRLYENRQIGVSLVNPASGEVSYPGRELVQFDSLNRTLHEHVEYPELLVDSTGRVWLILRRRASLSMGRRGIGRQFTWELLVSRYDTDTRRWTEPRLIADSAGRLDARVSAADAGKQIWLAWQCDHRQMEVNRPDVCSVFAGTLDLVGVPEADVSQAPLVAADISHTPPPTLQPEEAQHVAQVRAHTLDLNSRTLHIYRGDMHRHTETSSDGGSDGSMLDAYRYAIDAAALDFLLVTDHNDGNREYDWWLREKFNDLFRVGTSFVGLFGYERSLSYPNGHRNVFFTERGTRPLDILPQEQGRTPENSGQFLYPHLRENGGICFSHTSGTGMGTDWRDNDPQLEPLVEIFQGDRTNYEKVGAPWSAAAGDPATQEGGFEPLGYVDNALAKGYRLGFQASSDHLSTHLSYACILAESNTRQALFDAMVARHAYAATDNILLDVRCQGVDGQHIMGDVFTTAGPPTISVQAIGTGALQEVVIIRNDVVVYSTRGEGTTAHFTFTDMEAPTGQENYYYVRVLQADRRLAWASPMWITVAE